MTEAAPLTLPASTMVIGRHTTTGWTEERVAAVKRMWGDGFSASEIAIEIGGGLSRNAVIGKVHRLGLSGRVKPANKRPRVPTAKTVLHRERLERVATLRERLAAETVPEIAPTPTDGAVRSVLDLQDRHCRYPFGDPRHKDFHYCGKPRLQTDPPVAYCREHALLCFAPPRGRS